MKPYTVSILGHSLPTKRGYENMSVHMVTDALVDGFRVMPHVRVVGVVDVLKDPKGETIPPCDFVVVHALFYGDPGKRAMPFDAVTLKRRAPCRKIVLVLEEPSPGVDHSFCYHPFNRSSQAETVIPAPCPKGMLRAHMVPKDDRKVLLDHPWPADNFESRGLCLARSLRSLLEPFKDEFKVSQIDRYACIPDSPPWVSLIPNMPYEHYLFATGRFGTFVVTHAESWGHSVIDMAARGIRIVAPRGFIRPALARLVKPIEFDSAEEFVAALRQPIDHADWDRRIDAFTDFADVCKVIDAKFQEWL